MNNNNEKNLEDLKYESSQEIIDLATEKYETIFKYKNEPDFTAQLAAEKLNCSVSNIYVLNKKFIPGDITVFFHKNKNNKNNLRATKEVTEFIVNSFKDMSATMKNNGAHIVGRPEEWFMRPTYIFFYESISSVISIGKTRVIQILKDNQLYSSRSRVTPKHTDKLSIEEKDRLLMAGIENQMDGKTGVQFPDDDFECVFHSGVDGKVNAFTGGYFDKEETSKGYIKVIEQTFKNFGVPTRFITDNRSTFTTNKECGDKNVVIANGIKHLSQLITTSNAKRKNKVESKNDVFQIRVLTTLNLMGIRTMEEANKVIFEVLQKVNADLKNIVPQENAYTEFPENLDFNDLFAQKFTRSVHKYSQIQLNNTKYFAITEKDEIKYMMKSKSAQIIVRPDELIYIKYQGKQYRAIEATTENAKKYNVKYEFKISKIYLKERNDFAFKGKTYKLIDNLGEHVKISEGDSVVKHYDAKNNLLYVTKNKQKYNVVEGRFIANLDDCIMISEKTVTIDFRGQFRLNHCVYRVQDSNKLVVFGCGSKVNLVLENGIPSYIRHEKMILNVINISIISSNISLPTSKYVSHKHWEQYADQVKLIQL